MVKFIKEQYPPGTRIRLNSMNDPYLTAIHSLCSYGSARNNEASLRKDYLFNRWIEPW